MRFVRQLCLYLPFAPPLYLKVRQQVYVPLNDIRSLFFFLVMRFLPLSKNTLIFNCPSGNLASVEEYYYHQLKKIIDFDQFCRAHHCLESLNETKDTGWTIFFSSAITEAFHNLMTHMLCGRGTRAQSDRRFPRIKAHNHYGKHPTISTSGVQ